MEKKGSCRECKYADWDAYGCTCMIDGIFVDDASDYTCDRYRPAKPMTNADRIRQMTDEELAEFFDKISDCQTCIDNPSKCHMECVDSRLKWLKEVSEDAGSKTD